MKCCCASSGWRPWTTSPLMSMRAHLFQVHPQASSSGESSVRLNPVDWVALRQFGVDLRCRERFHTLWPAGDVWTVRWPSASWQYYDMQVLHNISARLQETASAIPCTYIGERDTLESEVGIAPFGHLSTLFYMTMQESLLTCNPEPHMHATEWSTTGRVTRTLKQ